MRLFFFPYNVLNQFFVITRIGDRVNAPPQRRAGSILIQEWQLRAPSDGSEFHFPWVLYTLNCSDRLTLLIVQFLNCFVCVLFLLCKVIFCFSDCICSLSAGKEEAAFWRAVHNQVMQISLLGGYIIHSPVAGYHPSAVQPKAGKKFFSRKKPPFFCFFFSPTASLVLLPNGLHFLSRTTEVVAVGVF